MWIFVIFALVYQPFFKVHLTKEIWQFLNLVLLILLIVGIIKYLKNKTTYGQSS